jgi:hypothetical protein
MWGSTSQREGRCIAGARRCVLFLELEQAIDRTTLNRASRLPALWSLSHNA